ncbi:hypothetical protein V493_07132 [Pseudogymnoascus sp. VKM F-4281 (FW-2241)]|nr:hypothetical protein V493_07132 [Pseudogymnoascus sp. VKM F-4281 (FW-2241)]
MMHWDKEGTPFSYTDTTHRGFTSEGSKVLAPDSSIARLRIASMSESSPSPSTSCKSSNKFNVESHSRNGPGCGLTGLLLDMFKVPVETVVASRTQ